MLVTEAFPIDAIEFYNIIWQNKKIILHENKVSISDEVKMAN